MGNCQTAEAAAVIIHHSPGGRVERAHGALSAAAVMAANPGHYVAAVVPAHAAAPAPAKKQRRLKLLRPDDTVALGGVYHLVSIEEVLREFVSKRHAATLMSRVVVATIADDAHRPESEADGSLAKQQARLDQEATSGPPDRTMNDHHPSDAELDFSSALIMLGGRFGLARHRQWRPALPSIAEGSIAC